MSPFIVFIVLLSAFLHALRDFLTKLGKNKLHFIWLYRIVGVVLFSPIFIYCVLRYPINSRGLLFAVLSGIIHCVYYIVLAETLTTGDISVVYPITRCTPIFLLGWSYFIAHEKMTFWGVLGILLVIVGTLFIQLDLKNLKKTFISVFQFKSYPVRMAWIVTVITALYSIVDDKGVAHINAFAYLYIIYFLSALFHAFFIFKKSKGEEVFSEWHANKFKIFLAGIVSWCGYLLILFAFNMERITYVVALRQVSVVFGVFLGISYLKERNKLIRISSALIIYGGICLITLLG